MPFHYRSGEESEIGDYVLFHGESGRIDFIADQLTANPAQIGIFTNSVAELWSQIRSRDRRS